MLEYLKSKTVKVMKGYYLFYVFILQKVGKSVFIIFPVSMGPKTWVESSHRIIGELIDTVRGAKEVGTDECRVGQVNNLQR